MKKRPEEVKWKDYADNMTSVLFGILLGIMMLEILSYVSTKWLWEWLGAVFQGIKYAWILGGFIIHNRISQRVKQKIHWEEVLEKKKEEKQDENEQKQRNS